MNDVSSRDRFLQAEEEANRLAAALESLRTEMEGYRDGTQHLSEVAQGLVALAEGLRPVLRGLEELIAGLAELGLPAARADLHAVKAMVARAEEEFESSGIGGLSQKVNEGFGAFTRQLQVIEAANKRRQRITIYLVIVVGLVLSAIQIFGPW